MVPTLANGHCPFALGAFGAHPFVELAELGIGVGLQDAGISRQMPCGVFAVAIARVEECTRSHSTGPALCVAGLLSRAVTDSTDARARRDCPLHEPRLPNLWHRESPFLH